MTDPVQEAPFEDEEIGEDEERTAAESREWLKHNTAIPNEDVLAEFGLSAEDFQRMGQAPIPTAERHAGS